MRNESIAERSSRRFPGNLPELRAIRHQHVRQFWHTGYIAREPEPLEKTLVLLAGEAVEEAVAARALQIFLTATSRTMRRVP